MLCVTLYLMLCVIKKKNRKAFINIILHWNIHSGMKKKASEYLIYNGTMLPHFACMLVIANGLIMQKYSDTSILHIKKSLNI